VNWYICDFVRVNLLLLVLGGLLKVVIVVLTPNRIMPELRPEVKAVHGNISGFVP
jgi:hypothetical protein